MPIYEYRCQACGHELEKLQRMSEAPLKDCPGCGKPALRRLISAAGFRLKGSGWYETDFKKDNQRNVVEAPAAEGEGKKAKSEETSKPAETESAESSKVESKSTSGSDNKKADAA